ncbi:MAG: nucleoside recognition protein [Xylanivirga thermophila]|jgi:spore maturation protein A|uniref:nucleoside recognition domain-containing protein n=1 Tax=Xylanivirga thermophila TaxID=2496273 RepID=UPI00101D7D95|nr:nucleoside recognition domain-containing protein [Xylanivirga thermophila]
MAGLIWLFLIICGIIIAFLQGNIEVVTQAALEGAAKAVEISFGLIGAYCLWLGLIKVAERAGLVKALSKRMGGIMGFLFPDVPKDHPAMGAMTMNIIANMLGLGNAATPFGLKAMENLQDLNKDRHTATNAMAMFLVINTSSVQLIPATVVALRTAAGSQNPAEIVGTALIATLCSTIVGIISAKILSRYM